MHDSESWPRYSEVLTRWIDESGLSLREIEDRCIAAGQKVTYSYISKLRSGAVDPPSLAITAAISEALGKDPTYLQMLQMVERMDDNSQGLFWSLVSLVLDPDKPLNEQLEGGRLQEFRRSLDRLPELTEQSSDARFDPLARAKYAAKAVKFFGQYQLNVKHRFLPMFDSVPASDEYAYLEAAGSLEVTGEVARNADYLLCVQDSDMADIGAWPGDLLLVQKGLSELTSGNAVLIRARGQVVARRYYQVPGSFRLEPALLAGQPIDPKQVEILGIIRGLIRHM